MKTMLLHGAPGEEDEAISTSVGTASDEEIRQVARELAGVDEDDAILTNGHNVVEPVAGFSAWKQQMAGLGAAQKHSIRTISPRAARQLTVAAIKKQITTAVSVLKNWKQGSYPGITAETVAAEVLALTNIGTAFQNRKELTKLLREASQRNSFLKPFYLAVFQELRYVANPKTKSLKGVEDYAETEDSIAGAEIELINGADDMLDGLDALESGIAGADDEGEPVIVAGVDMSDADLAAFGLKRSYTDPSLGASRKIAKTRPDKAAARIAVVGALQNGGGVLFLPLMLDASFNTDGVKFKKKRARSQLNELVRSTGAKREELLYSARVGVANRYGSVVIAVENLKKNNALAGADSTELEGAEDYIYTSDVGLPQLGKPKFFRAIAKKLSQIAPSVVNVASKVVPGGAALNIVAPKLSDKVQNLVSKELFYKLNKAANEPKRETAEQVAARLRASNRAAIEQATITLNQYIIKNKLSMSDLLSPIDLQQDASVNGAGEEETTTAVTYPSGTSVGAANDSWIVTTWTNHKGKIIAVTVVTVIAVVLYFAFREPKKKPRRRSGLAGASRRKKRRTSSQSSAPRRRKRRASNGGNGGNPVQWSYAQVPYPRVQFGQQQRKAGRKRRPARKN